MVWVTNGSVYSAWVDDKWLSECVQEKRTDLIRVQVSVNLIISDR